MSESGSKPPERWFQLTTQAQLAYDAGDYAKAVTQFSEALALFDDSETQMVMACGLTRLGRIDEAFTALGTLVAGGNLDEEQLLCETDIEPLYDDPRFAGIRTRAALNGERFRVIPLVDDLLDLPEVGVGSRVPLLVSLHGNGGNPQEFAPAYRSWALARGFAQLTICGSRQSCSDTPGGYTWVWSEAGIARIRRVIAETVNRVPVDGSRVHLFGLSQGAFMGLPTGLRHPALFRGVIAASGGLNPLPAEVLQAAAGRLPVFLIHGRQDACVTFATGQKTERYLREAGVAVHMHDFEGGHHLPSDREAVMDEAIAWIEATHRQTATRR